MVVAPCCSYPAASGAARTLIPRKTGVVSRIAAEFGVLSHLRRCRIPRERCRFQAWSFCRARPTFAIGPNSGPPFAVDPTPATRNDEVTTAKPSGQARIEQRRSKAADVVGRLRALNGKAAELDGQSGEIAASKVSLSNIDMAADAAGPKTILPSGREGSLSRPGGRPANQVIHEFSITSCLRILSTEAAVQEIEP